MDKQSSRIESPFGLGNRLRRLVWTAVQNSVFRVFPRGAFRWRGRLLRSFGARVAPDARVYGAARIWAPWNLTMQSQSILADGVNCYNVGRVTIEEGAIVSQDAYLCTAGHDIHHPEFPLLIGPITLGAGSWVGARAMIGPGVTVGARAVVALGAVVVRGVAPDLVVGGNPARPISRRKSAADRSGGTDGPR